MKWKGVYMKKIIPFKKEIIFQTNLTEITSISLEHSLKMIQDHTLSGQFDISGDYKMTDSSMHTDPFSFQIPFDIHLDEHYLLDKASVDINDFYYEIINDNILMVHIEVLVDHLEEEPLFVKEEEVVEKENLSVSDVKIPEEIEVRKEEAHDSLEIANEEVEEESPVVMPASIVTEERKEKDLFLDQSTVKAVEIQKETTEEVKSLFDHMDDTAETYTTYHVHIIREEETIENITKKYGILKEELEAYNDLSELKLGMKLIIPASNAQN